MDITNTAANTRIRREEFEKIPVGRSYQHSSRTVPGVVGNGNVNAMGALTSNNLFIIDSVDTTDPTTGTFGTNLNFEAIQEVSVYTSGVSAEYGRAQGAIVNVITKSGTNRYEGSAKYIFLNDNWDAQNTTTSEITGASLARVKFDNVNPVYTFTGGGPVVRNHAWFFGAYEFSKNTTPQQQTQGQIPEDYQQSTKNKFLSVRGTVQVKQGHTAWVKYYQAPTDGFVNNYWGAVTPAGEREALTLQNQTAKNWAAQYSGVVRSNLTLEAAFASYSSQLFVGTFEESGKFANAPIFNEADNKYYNGATFDGFTDRPRQQFNVASNWFLTRGARSHDVKVGLDFQNMESGAEFKYPNAQLYDVETYNQATGALVPIERQDYQTGPSISEGKMARDLRARQVPGHRPVLRRGGIPLGEADRDERYRRADGRYQRVRAAPVGQLRSGRGRQEPGHRQLRQVRRQHHPGLLGLVRERAAAGKLRQLPVERQRVCVQPGGPRRRFGFHAEHRPEALPHEREHGRLPAAVRPQHGRHRPVHRPPLAQPDRRHADVPRGRFDRPASRELRARASRVPGPAADHGAPLLEPLAGAGRLHLFPHRRQPLPRQLQHARRFSRRAVPHDGRYQHRRRRDDPVCRGQRRREQIRPSDLRPAAQLQDECGATSGPSAR